MSWLAPIDRLHARVVRVPALQLFTAMTRVLLAVGFIPPGLKKVLSERFTVMPVSNPIGFFFEAFYQAQLWYQTVGWAQLIAALLLLVPATAPLGAVLYLPIIVNIMLVTIAVGFQGTPVITVLMTLAALYLVCWDYDRWRALLPGARTAARPAFGGGLPALAALGCAAAGSAAYGAAHAIGLANVDRTLGAAGFPLFAAAGAVFGLVVGWHARRLALPPAEQPAPDAGGRLTPSAAPLESRS